MTRGWWSRSVGRACVVAALAAAFGLGAAVPGAAEPADYHIKPGDVLSVTVFGEPTLTQAQARVVPGGTIGMPLAGEVKVGGMTPAQAGSAIAAGLSKYLRHPRVTVAVEQVGTLDVLVLGNVKTPGKFVMQPNSRLTDALAAAGGLGVTDGDLPAARVETEDGTLSTVSLQKLLHDGDTTQDVPLHDETKIYIPSPNTFQVQVIGAVDHPGDVVLHDGDRLAMALARAGSGPSVNADLNHVVVRRIRSDGKAQSTTYNMYEVLKNGDLTRDVVMQKGDLVYVPQGQGKGDRVSPITGILYTIGHLVGLGL